MYRFAFFCLMRLRVKRSTCVVQSYFNNMSGTYSFEHFKQLRQEREKIFQPIGLCSENSHTKGSRGEILLISQTLVHRDQGIELIRHHVKQGSIVEGAPTHFGRCSDLVAYQPVA